MRIVIDADDLPGHPQLTVGVQRRGRPDDVLGPVRADAPGATWAIECTVRRRPEGLDVTGPHVEGRPGARFVYLSWRRDGEVVRRLKLMLDGVPAEVLALARDGTLHAALGLTDDRGEPRCAAVRPPAVRWTATS